MSDQTPIFRLLEALPQSGITPTVLRALDYLVPGAWQNITSFEGMIRYVTGEEDQNLTQQVGERALALYSDPKEGYQRAVWLYQSVDSVDKLAGAASLANKVGEKISFLGILDRITPESDTTQALDAGIKLAAELAAFCYTNGIPGDSIGDFTQALWQYEKEDAIRMASFIAIDCLIPLGPDFITKILDGVQKISSSELLNHPLFGKVRALLPGSDIDQQHQILQQNMTESAGFLSTFATSHAMTQQGLVAQLRQYVDIADDKLDYVAAALDMTTNYFEHTGLQSVSRRLISRAYGEI